ncbi:hypothetical protein MKW98_003147 [Papaver atlanticum]|uniref:Threonylcarbamoyl-AMP synthase n=1 Tax=Papaver atlanticum TaxID=357466 RepID=A0AAD4THT0_9MAGN|nr:hypothetical protein MKW98_003147 [Papaver atlanticum]
MNFPAKIAEKLPVLGARFSHPFSNRDALWNSTTKLRFLNSRHRIRGLVLGLSTAMEASDSKRCGLGLDNRITRAVLPATESYVDEATQAIKQGKVIAVSAEAVHRIYEIKGRKQTSPLAICVGDVKDIERFAVTDHLPNDLLASLLPGPVTVVLIRGESSILEKSLNPGLDSIGVRVPDSEFIRVIARGSGSALALTSANLSGQPSSVCIKDFENLWEHCKYVYDGGLLPSGRAGSTVVDLTKLGKYKILRPGSAMEETVAILQSHSLQEDKQ